MTAYTPNLNLPYPEGTDFIADGDNTIQALAENLDGTVISTTVVPSSGSYEGNVVACRTSNGLVLYLVNLGRTSSFNAEWHNIGVTLPAGFKPMYTLNTPPLAFWSDPQTQWQLKIAPTGVVQVRETGANTSRMYYHCWERASTGTLLDPPIQEIEEAIDDARARDDDPAAPEAAEGTA